MTHSHQKQLAVLSKLFITYGSYGSYMDFYCLIGERLPATGEVASLQRSQRDIVPRPFL